MDEVPVNHWRDRAAKALMLTLALGASIAFAASSRAVAAAAPGMIALEVWRMIGDLALSAVFIILALRPRQQAGLWEIAFFHYAGVAVFLAVLAPGAFGVVALVDALIAATVAASYILARGYLAWNVSEPAPAARPIQRVPWLDPNRTYAP